MNQHLQYQLNFLEWCDNKYNTKHAIENGNFYFYAGNNRKLTLQQENEIKQKYIPNVVTRQQLADEYKVSLSVIKRILSQK